MKQRGTTWQNDNLLEIRYEKVSSFVKFEIILPLLCFLLDPGADHPGLILGCCQNFTKQLNIEMM